MTTGQSDSQHQRFAKEDGKEDEQGLIAVVKKLMLLLKRLVWLMKNSDEKEEGECESQKAGLEKGQHIQDDRERCGE